MAAVTPKDLVARLAAGETVRLLDVRQPEEFSIASLPGAKLVPLDALPARVGELEGWKEDEVVVYCHHGVRSAHAIGWLRTQGFEQLVNLSGGIDRWSLEVDSEVPRY